MGIAEALIASAIIGVGSTAYSVHKANSAQKKADKAAKKAEEEQKAEQKKQFDMATLRRQAVLTNMREGVGPIFGTGGTSTGAGLKFADPQNTGWNSLG